MRILSFLLLCLAGTCVRAQHAEALALTAYLHNDVAKWDAALAAAAAIPDPEKRLLTRAEYQLNRGYAAMVADDDAALDDVIAQMDEALDQLWEIDDENAVAHGLYSALLGLKIARKPISGMIHGSRAANYAEKAAKLGPQNGAALHHAAANLYYTPPQWGGDPEQALRYLEQAVDTYGPDRNSDWRYLSTLALMGQVQRELGQTDRARATYELALAAQPDFGYVSKVLLPQLKQ